MNKPNQATPVRMNHPNTKMKTHIVILFAALAAVSVIAVPHYSRQNKIDAAKEVLKQLQEATNTIVQEYERTYRVSTVKERFPSDQYWLYALNQHFSGSIPFNPFTKNRDVTLQPHKSMTPCVWIESTGGWIWKLIPPQEKDQSIISRVWLNSDTFDIGNNAGEACLQP